MFMIVLTNTLSDFIAIFKNLMHLLENHNSISIHPAQCGRSTQCVVQGTRIVVGLHTPLIDESIQCGRSAQCVVQGTGIVVEFHTPLIDESIQITLHLTFS